LTLSVRHLVALPELELALIAGHEEQDREVRSVHTTDLEHPGRYVLPGELVLTNGLWLGAVEPDAWVAELGERGATALGFGLGTPHSTVPGQVIAACERRTLPLIEVPETLSFVAIADAVSASDAENQLAVFRRHLARSRTMLRGLSEGREIAFLLKILLDETRLDSTLVSPGGRIIASTGPDVRDDAGAAFVTVERDSTVFEGSGPNRRSTPSLVVWAAAADIDDEARVVANQVMDHVELAAGWRRSERQAVLGIAQELVDGLRVGAMTQSAFEARVAAVALDPRLPVAVMALGHDAERAGAALDAAGGEFAIVPTPDGVIALVQPVVEDPVTAVAAAVRHLGENPTIGDGGSGLGPLGVARSLGQATIALQLARHRPIDARVVRHDDLGSHALLLGLLDPAVLSGFREQVLGPVARWDAEHRTDLLQTVATFIEHGGRWRATAGELHIHHNTLRYRLGRFEALTGKNLANAADRLDVQLALLVLP
jgi:PucR family transcriptional regulator, purine catabolism regulatory protein